MFNGWPFKPAQGKSTNTTNVPTPQFPPREVLESREPIQLEDWRSKAFRWRRAVGEDPMEHVPGIYALDLAHFSGALIEEVLDLKSRVEELEKQKAPSNTGEGQS